MLGVGRIGKMHAELLSPARCPVPRWRWCKTSTPTRPPQSATQFDVPHTTDVDEVLASADVDAVAICSSTDTHVPLMIAAANAGKAIFCEKPISLDLGKVDEALAPSIAASGVPFQVGFNRRFDAAHASVRAAVVDGSVGDLHIVRITSRDPAPPPISVHRGVGWHLPRHDDPRLRHGPVRHRQRGRRGVRRRLPCESIRRSARPATSTLPSSMLRHENGCITTIDNSRQAVYGYDQRVEAFGSGGMAASENPLTHTGMRRSAAGTISQTIPYFFLDRYIPSYVEEWKSFVAYVADGGDSPVSANDGRAPLVIGLAAWKSYREGRPVRCDEIG